MYVVAIAWIYVVLMVSLTQPTVLRAVVTFVGAGLFPLALFLYLVGTPQRRRNQARAQAEDPQRPADLDRAGSVQPDQSSQLGPASSVEPGQSSQISEAMRPVTRSRLNE